MFKLNLKNKLPFKKPKASTSTTPTKNGKDTDTQESFAMNVALLGFDKAEELSKLDMDSGSDKKRKAIQDRLGVDMSVTIDDLELQRGSMGLDNPEDGTSKAAKDDELATDVTLITEMTENERRVQYEAIARIERLMFQMRSHPDTIDDFLNFAKESSNTETSISFMESLFYYTQSTNDTKVVVELARLSAQEMFATIDEIINMKMRKIENLPMTIVMLALIPIFAILVTFLVTVGINAFGGMF